MVTLSGAASPLIERLAWGSDFFGLALSCAGPACELRRGVHAWL